MYFYEYMDKEIPMWKNSLRTEYVEQIRAAFMNCYNLSKEIELLKDMYQKNSTEQYKKMIQERELKLEQYEINLKIVTEYSKQHENKEKTVYDHAREALQRIKAFRQNYDEITEEVDEDYKRLEEKGKSL